MSLEDLAIVATAVAGVTAVLVQFLKDLVIDPNIKQEPQRSSVLRAANYLLNLGLLLLYLATKHQIDWSLTFEYLVVSFGGAIATQVGYKVVNSGAGINPTETPTPIGMSGKVDILPPPPDQTQRPVPKA